MKKNLFFLVSVLSAFLLIVSCQDAAGTGLVLDGIEALPVVINGNELTISIASISTSESGLKSNYNSRSGIQRNIQPDDWTDTRASALTYVLTGTASIGGNTVNVPITDGVRTDINIFTFSAIKGGTAKISLEPAVWNLVLTAYQDSSKTKIALVSAETACDLTNGNGSTQFAMKAPSSTTATGEVEVKLQFNKPNNFDKVVYGIYTDSMGTTPIDTTYSTKPATFTSKETADAGNGITAITVENAETQLCSVTYTNNAINAFKKDSSDNDVNYYFCANFYNSEGTLINFHSEKIVVDGGNISTKTVKADGFNTAPQNPTSLAYVYKYNGTTPAPLTLDSATTTPTTYDLELTWDDNSKNELGFEIVVTDITDAENKTSVTYTPKGTPNLPKAGTLKASTTTATVELQTGKIYTIKIHAYNNYMTATDEAAFYELTDELNLYTVTYNLNGGSVKIGNNNTTDPSSVDKYVVPYNKDTNAINLLTGNNATLPYVLRTNYSFIRWYKNGDGTRAKVETVAANNTENVIVDAYWESEMGVTLTLPSYQTIEDYIISDVANNSITVSGIIPSGSSDVTVTIQPNTNVTITSWKLYKLSVADKVEIPSTDPNLTVSATEFVWIITKESYTDVDAGTYYLDVQGKYKAGDPEETALSNTITITVER